MRREQLRTVVRAVIQREVFCVEVHDVGRAHAQCLDAPQLTTLLQLFGLPSPQLVYIESWARVRSLSLTARLVRPFVDRFVVQWPEAAGPLRDGEQCRGWLV
jgi:hypothetical protein